jgi:molybdopterin molybdotransferase
MDCAEEYDPGSLLPEEARARMAAAVSVVAGTESVGLLAALDRILATDLLSPVAVPAHANAAMDGYAVRIADLPTGSAWSLPVAGVAHAGHPFGRPLPAGCAVRIMTGAVVPEGADAVVMQEQVTAAGMGIRSAAPVQLGQNIRAAGEDLRPGQRVLAAGRKLSPADLGLAASLGVATLAVRLRLRVAFFTTGDELRSLGEPLGPGEIYDSNRYTLQGLLMRLGVEPVDLGVVRDDRIALEAAFRRAAAQADVVITTAGVSVGEADLVKEVFARLGEIHLWKVAMKPGRPLAFGRMGDAAFFGLPGNPVSAMVTFYQFVQPTLRLMQGEAVAAPLSLPAVAGKALRKKPGRVEYQRGILSQAADGGLTVVPTGPQGSGILHSMSLASCFIVLPLEAGDLPAGSVVMVQPFAGIIS